jgi:hypothetical protein
MNKSESVSKLAPALAKAYAAIGGAQKGAKNPFFKSSYADLGSVMEACKEPLLDQGIIVLQPVGRDEQGGYVETLLLHESGEWISDKMRITCAKENDPQAYGSAVTYARRYGLQSMVFIPSVDDDGESAMARSSKPAPKKEEPKSDEPQFNGPNHQKLFEELAEKFLSPDDFMAAMKQLKKIPETAKSFFVMSDKTASAYVGKIAEIEEIIIEYKALHKP